MYEATHQAAENIVAALWKTPEHFPLVLGRISPSDMPSTAAGTLFRLMAEQANGGIPTIGLLESQAVAEGVPQDYIARLGYRMRNESVEALEGYASVIADSAAKRKTGEIAQWMLAESSREEVDADALNAEAVTRLTQEAQRQSELKHISRYVDEAEARMESWFAGQVEGRSSGFRTLDKTFRLVDGELTIIAARPGQGKTSMGMQMVERAAQDMRNEGDSGTIAVFSADMAGWRLTVRMACALAGVNSRLARRNEISSDEKRLLREKMSLIRSLPIHIDDSSGPTSDEIYYRLMMVNAKTPVRMMLFDFMELNGDRGQTEELRISGFVRQLAKIRNKLNIPVIALSQLSRKVEEMADKMPQMSHMRYSGQIEAVADNVLLIMRPEYYLKREDTVKLLKPEDDEGVAYVIHAKGRDDGADFYRLHFEETLSRFSDLELDAKEPPAQYPEQTTTMEW